jgi:tetratricopeptide (TPR) repeat protein
MRDITEDEIRSAFGEKTFTRGQDYFENGYVERGIKKGDNLIGNVLGSLPHPYRTEVEITDDIYSECSCPVENMCKHGVALLLQWVHEKDSFVDCDRLLISLREKSKEELITIVNSMLADDPALAWKLAFTEEVTKKKVNIDALSKRLRYLSRGYLEYYEVDGVVRELEKVKKMADSLVQEGCLKDAVEVYLLLIEWGVDAFVNGVDDSDGNLGEVIIACVEDFNKCVKPFKEEKNLINRILNIIEVEYYGLETQEMLYSLVTKKNIVFIEEELLRRISVKRDEFDSRYRRREFLDLLSGLYEELDMPEDCLRVLKNAGLQDDHDYMRMAMALKKQGRYEEALHHVREGLRLEKENFMLSDLYFELLQLLLKEKRT